MDAEYLKPLPKISDENRPFWEAAQKGKLSMQACSDCGHIRFPISHVCPRCLSYEFEWADLSGRGRIYSYVIFHRAYQPAFAGSVPYNVALVQLEEGPRMFSNIIGVDNGTPKVGDAVQAAFDEVAPGVTLPRFRLACST